MKNKKGFTLIELLAVIIILAVIMTIAIPNVVSTIERNKRDSFIEDAKRMISLAKYKIRSDTSIEWPTEGTVTVISLATIDTNDIVTSPYDTKYCLSKSYVAIALDAEGEPVYYAQLVSCTDDECENLDDNSVSSNHGINLASEEELSSSDRFSKVATGSEVLIYPYRSTENEVYIRTMLSRSNVNFY